MKRKVVIHMLDDHRDGIEGVVDNITFSSPPRIAGPMQDAFVEVTLSWNRDANRCGPFEINIGPLADNETRHFDLVLHPDIPLPIPKVIARIFSDHVGLRPWNGEERCPDSEIRWGESDQPPCYVTGVGTPYDLESIHFA